MKTKLKKLTLALAAAGMIASSTSNAGWDPVGDIKNGAKKLSQETHNAAQGISNGMRNVIREGSQAVGNVGREIADAPDDLNDLHRVPRKIEREFGRGGRNLEAEAGRFMAHLGDEALADWIQRSRNEARRRGTQPIPPAIYQRLAYHFAPDLLNRVQFRVGRGEVWTLQSGAFNHAGANAITLIDTIVFSSWEDAMNDVLWAHEMRHVAQYANRGLKGFAYHYMANRSSIENEAEWVAGDYACRWYGC